MKWKATAGAAVFVLLGVFIGMYMVQPVFNRQPSGFVPFLTITGDVENTFVLKNIENVPVSDIEHDGKKQKAAALADIVSRAGPLADRYEILFRGDDGLTACLDGNSLEGCFILFTGENAWEAVNFNHPVSSNIKRIEEIVVVAKNANAGNKVSLITPVDDLGTVTPGQLYSRAFIDYPLFEGESSVEREGKTNQVRILTRRRLLKVSELADVSGGSLLIMGDNGSYGRADADGYLELKGNSVDYVYPDLKNRIKGVRGIMKDPPAGSIMDTYHDTVHFLEKDEKVLLIILDGFGYHQYRHAVDNWYAPVLKSLPMAKPVSTVYTPVTNAGLAAMFTGKPPCDNGVYSRQQKDLNEETIFGVASRMGIKSLLVEGNIKILNTEIEPRLNVDSNSNGIVDDDILNTALENMNGEYRLMAVHFHGIDDSGHNSGDLSEETMKAISRTDGYIGKLISRWEGKVIIVADHGMHSTDEGGDHGEFQCRDMIVPYILTDGEGEI